MSKKICTFAADLDAKASRTCVRAQLNHELKRLTNMKTQETKQMPLGSENIGTGTPQQMYFTADEAMAFLEPRIRAMFR